MAWKITKETVTEETDSVSRVGWVSPDYVEGMELPYKFRMRYDDNEEEVAYYGYASSNDDDDAFAPLDDLGTPDAGCTIIEYFNDGKWEIL